MKIINSFIKTPSLSEEIIENLINNFNNSMSSLHLDEDSEDDEHVNENNKINKDSNYYHNLVVTKGRSFMLHA